MLNTLTIEDFTGSATKKQISRPPLNLLFNPSLIDRDDVWKIDVVKLLEMLLAILKASGNNDLRVCGVAILTSALIHRLKVESIFKLDKLASQKETKDNKGTNNEKKMPVPELENISLPFRKETLYPASLEELLLILENMITELSNPTVRKNQVDLEPVQTFDFQEYLIKFEKVIEEYEIRLFDILVVDKEVLFNSFVKEMDSLEIARYFIAMLYLAMKGKASISYDKTMEAQTNEHGAEGSVSIGGTPFRGIDNLEIIKITVIDG
jgi:segregation and condensation protein A